jgi:hypothetical protein
MVLAMFSRPHSEIREAWLSLPGEYRDIFPSLAWGEEDDRFYKLPIEDLRYARIACKHALEGFEEKQRNRDAWVHLMSGDAAASAQCIQAACRHLKVDLLYHVHAQDIRANGHVSARLRPVLAGIADLGIADIKRYGKSNRAEDFRNGFVLIIPAIRLSPSLGPYVEAQLSAFVRAQERHDFLTSLLIPSMCAEGYAQGKITDQDRTFARLWEPEAGSPLGFALGQHTASYEAPPRTGWNLMKMHPRDAVKGLRRNRAILRRSLIENTYKKCVDPHANAARLIARFRKMHLGLHATADHPYANLPHDLARMVREMVRTVRGAASAARTELPNQKALFGMLFGVENRLPHLPSLKRPGQTLSLVNGFQKEME